MTESVGGVAKYAQRGAPDRRLGAENVADGALALAVGQVNGRAPVPAELADGPFQRACRRESVSHTPVWFMRQAGRSLPEYRKVREGIGMLDSCRRADLVTEITLQPVRRHGVDAA